MLLETEPYAREVKNMRRNLDANLCAFRKHFVVIKQSFIQSKDRGFSSQKRF